MNSAAPEAPTLPAGASPESPFPELALRPEIGRPRQVYVNRHTDMSHVDLIGFDMDHTLAVYRKRHSEELAFDLTLDRLVTQRGYPEYLRELVYDRFFVTRGLIIDKQTGNIIKPDRHNHVGRAYHGRRRLTADERRALYRHEKIRLSAPRWAWVDTLFALPEACLYAFVVEAMEGRGDAVDFLKLYDDIRAMIDLVHRDDSLKSVIRGDLDRYLVRDSDLGPMLHKLRSAGKKLFLATNSHWDYTEVVMSHLLDGVLPEYPRWTRYFDTIVAAASKPSFFSEQRPFLELDPQGRPLGEARTLERGKVYQGGNLQDLERMLGISGERVLYVGDHIYGDILRSRKVSLWRTCMVVEELEDEIAHVQTHGGDLRRTHEMEARLERVEDEVNNKKGLVATIERKLDRAGAMLAPDARARLEEAFRAEKVRLEQLRREARALHDQAESLWESIESAYNPYWGYVFKEGRENSRFGEQVEEYACLYTSRASNFLYYSPMQSFRSPREQMPHERTSLT